LAVPAPPAELVERPRLYARLDAGVQAPLTLLGAPAGWGKTVLLSSWLRAGGREPGRPVGGGPDRPVAWLSVEPGDGGGQFWRYLHAALSSCGVPLGDLAGGETEPAAFAGALAGLPAPVVLVLDDLDHLGDGGVLDGLDFLLRHAAGRLRLVVAARTDPALALHRWRVRGELTELRAADLAFTVAETAQLLAGHGLAQPGYAAELRARTEGWPAGERLAALSMMEQPDPARFLPAFTGDDARVAEYLRGEVLASLPGEARDVLLDTSILQRVCGGLIEALTGRTDGERILADLDRSSAFLVPLDGRPSWRRYHRLFGELLRAELHRRSPDRVAELHRRATGWLAAHGLPLDALRHALAAADFGQATGVLVEHWPELVGHTPDVPHVHSEPLPAAAPAAGAVRANPELGLAYVVDRLGRGDLDGAGGLLPLAERNQHLLPPGRRDRFAVIAAALRLGHAQSRGDPAALAAAASRMLALLGPRPPDGGAAIALTGLGTARLAAGELAAAQDALAEALAMAGRAGLSCPRLSCAGRLAFTQALRGQLRAAERTARDALSQPDSVHYGYAYLALSIVDIERDQLADAGADLARAEEPGDGLRAGWTALVQARLLGERGELAQAQDAVRRARHGLGEPRPPRYLEHCFASAEADLCIGNGDTRAARKLLAEYEPGGPAMFAACLARAHLQDGDPDAAIQALPDWAGDGAGGYPLRLRLDAGLTEALAARQLAETRHCRDAMERVLRLAEPDGFRRVFRRPGARELLLDHLDSGTAYWSMVADLLAATTTADPAALRDHEPRAGEPLTDRELAVLRYLPSMLSNVEIATSLCLSVNTVKTHVRHIYRKLHATRRREAVRRARELHLL
jgi:LuxR family maltose regulon positive regulatory protein